MCVCVCVHVYVNTYVYVCICMYICVYMYVCICVCLLHICIYFVWVHLDIRMWMYVLLVSVICVLDSTLVFRFGKMASWDVALICITGLMPAGGLVWEAGHAPVLVLERLMHTNHTLGKLFVENEYVYALLKRSFSAAILQKLK